MTHDIYLKQLLRTLVDLQTETEALEFLQGILTPAELEQLPVRLEIVRRLKQGQPQRQIASDLGVGVATVSRGAREIQQGRFENIA